MATQAQRTHAAALMDMLVANEPLIDYLQHRPMRTGGLREQQLATRFAQHGKIAIDCSESVTLICRLAGLDDPNGQGYNGYGFTGTMLKHLTVHYSDPKGADVGALVVFGPGDGDHVCMVRRKGANPLLFSHGQQKGPVFVRYSVEKAAHRSPATFLSVAKL